MIPLQECLPRHIYRLHSRNLAFGVYDGANGFIGIREKFGHRYLDTEYHYDTGFGTARPIEDIGVVEDTRIRILTGYPLTYCNWCGDILVSKEGVKGFVHKEPRPDCVEPGHGIYRDYKPLFDFLDDFDI